MIERVQMLTVAPIHDQEIHDPDSPRIIAGGRQIFADAQDRSYSINRSHLLSFKLVTLKLPHSFGFSFIATTAI
ncbi:hypothetical protein PGB90_004471 [Kerria lacca]